VKLDFCTPCERERCGADTLTVAAGVSISICRRGARKLVLAPDGTNVTTAPVRRHVDNAMVKAIARAFRWREMLETGTHAGRVLRLTLLAPDIVEAILGGRQPAGLTLARLMRPFPVGWRSSGQNFSGTLTI
jgi:hypothetical protein